MTEKRATEKKRRRKNRKYPAAWVLGAGILLACSAKLPAARAVSSAFQPPAVRAAASSFRLPIVRATASAFRLPIVRAAASSFRSPAAQVKAFTEGGPGTPFYGGGDPYCMYQWGFRNNGLFSMVDQGEALLASGPDLAGKGTTYAVEGMDINLTPATQLYDSLGEKSQVVVAVIDTGVDIGHEDLAGSIWVNSGEIPGDGVDNDGNGFIDDVNGWNFYSGNNQVYAGSEDSHGTHSAGTIAAARNGVGIAGICDPAYVKIMPLKVLATEDGIGTTENVARAIRYAEANGASVCNLSFGTGKFNQELYDVMKDSSMLFVVAAGNGGADNRGYNIDETPVYPAGFELDNIISVASMRLNGQLDPSSNYGPSGVDLAAPGKYVLSAIAGNQYGYMSGTSMAAPMVSGTAAMIKSACPGLDMRQIRAILLQSAKKNSAMEGKVATGGMLDAGKALETARNQGGI